MPQNPQTPEMEKEQTPEKQSGNYFERANSEYNKLLLKGEIKDGAVDALADRVSGESKKGFFAKCLDAIQQPKAAIEWFLKSSSIGKMLAESWFGEIFGLKKKVDAAKDAAMEAIKNPVNILTGILGAGAFAKILTTLFGSSDVKNLKKSPSPLALLKLGRTFGKLGIAGAGIFALVSYFRSNPDEAKSMPQNKDEQKSWWLQMLEKAGIDDEAESIVALVVGEKTAEQMFGGADGKTQDGKEQKEKPENEKYGEMVPIGEKIPQFYEGFKSFLLDVQITVNKNKELAKALGALGTGALFVTPQGRFVGRNILALLKTPLGAAKFVGGLSLPAMILVAGLLYSGKSQAEEIRVPKDNDQFKKFIKDKLADSGDAMADQAETLGIDEAAVDSTFSYILGEKSLQDLQMDAGKLLSASVSYSAEKLTLTPEELIFNQNKKGFENLRLELQKQGMEKLELYNLFVSFQRKYEVMKQFPQNEFQKLCDEAGKSGIKIKSVDGVFQWMQVNADGVIQKGPFSLCIDPKLSVNDAKEKAERFIVEFSSDAGVAEIGHIPLDQLRLLGGGIFKEVKDENEARGILETMMRAGGQILLVGNQLYFEGVAERFVLGPFDMFKNIFKAFSGDFSATECAVDYADGILPVVAFGLTQNLVSSAWHLKNPFAKGEILKVVGKSIVYPISGAYSVGKFSWKHILEPLLERDYDKILKDPANMVQAGFKENLFKLKERVNVAKSSVLNPLANHAEKEALKLVSQEQREVSNIQNLIKQALEAKEKSGTAQNQAVEELVVALKKKGILPSALLTPEGVLPAGKIDEVVTHLKGHSAAIETRIASRLSALPRISSRLKSAGKWGAVIGGALLLGDWMQKEFTNEEIPSSQSTETQQQTEQQNPAQAQTQVSQKETQEQPKMETQISVFQAVFQQEEKKLQFLDDPNNPDFQAKAESQIHEYSKNYLQLVASVKQFAIEHRAELIQKIQTDKKGVEINDQVSIEFDAEKGLYIHYTSEEKVIQTFFMEADNKSVLRNVAESGVYFIPGVGVALGALKDGYDAVKSGMRGDFKTMKEDLLWAGLGVVGTALMFVPGIGWVGTAGIQGARALRVAKTVGRSAMQAGKSAPGKIVQAAEVGMIAKDIATIFKGTRSVKAFI